jgi:hypothetical protein
LPVNTGNAVPGDPAPIPRQERRMTPRLLPVCCVCGLIRDESGPSPVRVHWITPLGYRKTYGVNPTDFPLTHTYCPGCLRQAQDTMRKDSGKIGP